MPIATVLALGLAAPAFAQEAAPPAPTTATPGADAPAAQAATAKAGDTVYDTSGQAVGTVESVSDGNFVISTGSSKATLSLASLGTGPNGPTISMTKAQLEAAIAQAKPQG